MMKFAVAFVIVWLIVFYLLSFVKFSDTKQKLLVLKILTIGGFVGIISSVVLFFVVQIF